jgi:sugar phosphate permease
MSLTGGPCRTLGRRRARRAGLRTLLGRFNAPSVLALGFTICAAGELALSGLGVDSSWTDLVPGLAVIGIGSGLTNASLGRLAVASVPRERAGTGSGANNTARYLGGAAGVALVVALATGSAGGNATGLLHGWNTAAIVCAALCLLAALVAAACRTRQTCAGVGKRR